MTMRTIAQLAGVSLSTVSKAFSDSTEVSPETRERIFAVARENGCFEKYYKRQYEKKVIAIICPELISEYYSTMVAQLAASIEARGAETVLSLHHFDTRREKALFEYHSFYQKADGIILIGNGALIRNTERVPLLMLGRDVPRNTDAITIDMLGGVREAVAHLVENGHTKIGYIGESLTIGTHEHFTNALKTQGICPYAPHSITANARFEQGGYEGMEKLLRVDVRPTAVLCAYDAMAFGAIHCLQSHGLSVPADMSVIGINNLAAAAYPNMSLTTVKTMTEDVCDTAADLILKKTDSKYFAARKKITVYCRLIKRDSVRNLREE